MNLPRKCTATKALLTVALLCAAAWVQAAPVIGSVSHLSGPLFVNKADGSARVLASQSTVEVGDSLTTAGQSYAQIRFSDNSLLTLEPNTVITLDAFAFDRAAPAGDKVSFTLRQGGVSTQAGELARRSLDRVALVTPLGRLDLQGASAVVQYFPQPAIARVSPLPSQRLASMTGSLASSVERSDSSLLAVIAVPLSRVFNRVAGVLAWAETWIAQSHSVFAELLRPLLAATPVVPASYAGVPPGLYVHVIDGLINLSNQGGVQSFSAGQFGFAGNLQLPPVVVPQNPGLKFNPPPAFNSSVATTTSGAQGKTNQVDCVVR